MDEEKWILSEVDLMPPPSGPKWATEARDRLYRVIRDSTAAGGPMFRPDRRGDAEETRQTVTDFLREGFRYTHEELTTEYAGEFADYCVRIDGDLIAFIKVEPWSTGHLTTKLATTQVRQLARHAVNESVEWAIITNGLLWKVFHVGSRTPIEIDLAMDVNLAKGDRRRKSIDELFYLTRESMSRRQIDEFWHARRATTPRSLAGALTSDVVAEAIRNEIRHSSKQWVEREDVKRLLRETVIRPECFE